MNRHVATFITLAIPSLLLVPIILETLSPEWHPLGSEAAGSIFLFFAMSGTSTTILAFSVILNQIIQRNIASYKAFIGFSCLTASITSAAAFFLYPILTAMKMSNFDASLVIPIVVMQCILIIPLATLWWWLVKPQKKSKGVSLAK